MVVKSSFQGRFYYYENINGKEKKIEKTFDNAKSYSDFVKKYPMPTFSSFFGLAAPKLKALPSKKHKAMACCKTKKTPAKKKAKKRK